MNLYDLTIAVIVSIIIVLTVITIVKVIRAYDTRDKTLVPYHEQYRGIITYTQNGKMRK